METDKAHLHYLQNMRRMFYLVTPNETFYERTEDVPNFVDQAIPCYILMVMLECVVLAVQGKELPRVNDSINSWTHALLCTIPMLLCKSTEITLYNWVYNNCNIIDLPWNCVSTWTIGMLAVDFFFYWFHRISHETNIGWASHQVHHSSEEFNLTTAVRQSVLHRYFSTLIFLPMAIFVPPSVYSIHRQFNFLYQLWLHTKTVSRLGPLELILNTPSHHRVHHARNRRYVNKNYAGVFIIWDYMFNSFEDENNDREIAYGLCFRNLFWNPFFGQLYLYFRMFNLVRQMPGFMNKLCVLVCGPGWRPGFPRQFPINKLPKVKKPIKKFDSKLQKWADVYVLLHFLVVTWFYRNVVTNEELPTFPSNLGLVLFFGYSCFVFGALYDHRIYAHQLEFIRCLLTLFVIHVNQQPMDSFLAVFYFMSCTMWIILFCFN